jgi:hypothetical protein
LCLERLHQAEERPPGAGVLAEILPVHGLCFIGAARGEQHRAQILTNRRVPVRRLLVIERVLVAHRALEVKQRRVPVLPARRDFSGDHLASDAEDRMTRIGRKCDR